MGYGQDLANAAQRHLEAAKLLDREFPQGRRDVAGYLYGMAAECALKQIMWRSGMREQKDKKNDPFYLHFPELKTALRVSASGRFQAQLLRYANDSRLMRDWSVKMRYAHSSDVLEKPIDEWAKQARDLTGDMRAP